MSTVVSLQLRDVSKDFGNIAALRNVDLRLKAGEIHGLIGANGAGKTTLARIIAGEIKPDSGTIEIGGKTIQFTSRRQAMLAGISIAPQEPAIAPDLTVAENIFLGVPNNDRRKMLDRGRRQDLALRFLESYGLRWNLRAHCGSLSPADWQLLQVLRLRLVSPRIALLDEPTASLNPREVELVHRVIRELARSKTTVVLITHHLRELKTIAERVSVLRNGIRVATENAQNSDERWSALMWGSETPVVSPQPPMPRTTSQTASFSFSHIKRAMPTFRFTLRDHCVVGLRTTPPSLASLALRSAGGIESQLSASLQFSNERSCPTTPREAVASGIFYSSRDRLEEALFPDMSVIENLMFLAIRSRFGLLDRRAMSIDARALASRVDLDGTRLAESCTALSGGNKQKLLFARGLCAQPRIWLLDDPSQGIDQLTIGTLLDRIRDLREESRWILVASPDHEFLSAVSDHIIDVDEAGHVRGSCSDSGTGG